MIHRRKPALVVLGPLVATLAIAGLAVAATPWNHDPGSAVGPTSWGTIDPAFAACEAGISQSPVDISETVRGGGPALVFSYPDNELVVGNTGHVIEVPIPTDNGHTLRVGGRVYGLNQYHFHAPSEHTLNGRHFDLEVHLVHANAAGALLVVGVLMDSGDHPNALVDDVFRIAPDVAGEEIETGLESNARELLPGRRPGGHDGRFVLSRYYTYSGSLTTPPCSEPVQWFVAKDPVTVSDFSVTEMHELVSRFPNYGGYPDNNRPVQPLHGRTTISRG